MAKIILDASAVLALLNAEPGADLVIDALPGAAISAVNFSEVVSKLHSAGMPEKATFRALESLALEVIPFDKDQAYQAGFLIAATRSAGISLGDRACLSLARSQGAPALTADKAWATLSIGVTVKSIR